MKRQLQALAVFLLLGAVKLPVEEAATCHLREAKLLTKPISISLRESLGQASFAASLGGLRSLVASITYLRVKNARKLETGIKNREKGQGWKKDF